MESCPKRPSRSWRAWFRSYTKKAPGSRRGPAPSIDCRWGWGHAWHVGLTSRSLPRFLFTGRAVQMLRYLPQFARLYWRLFRDRRVSVLPKALLILTIVYVVWPFDVVPDVLPF